MRFVREAWSKEIAHVSSQAQIEIAIHELLLANSEPQIYWKITIFANPLYSQSSPSILRRKPYPFPNWISSFVDLVHSLQFFCISLCSLLVKPSLFMFCLRGLRKATGDIACHHILLFIYTFHRFSFSAGIYICRQSEKNNNLSN